MPRGMLMDASVQAFLRFVRKFSRGRSAKPPCSCALERVALTISM